MSEKKQYVGEYIQRCNSYLFDIDYVNKSGNDENGAFTIIILLDNDVHIIFSKQYDGKNYLLYYVGIKFEKSIYGQWVQKEDIFNNGYFWMSEDSDTSDEKSKKHRDFLPHINQSELKTLLYKYTNMQINDVEVNTKYIEFRRIEAEEFRDAGLVARVGDIDDIIVRRLIKENMIYKKIIDFIKPMVERIEIHCGDCANRFCAFDVRECGIGEEKECLKNNHKFFKPSNDFLEILLGVKDVLKDGNRNCQKMEEN